mmetsp:Transcript_43659/g.70941  ORF Transcript_43659/g.70941 Transcript_43659/m.70941 type:complete len:343 (+) Transcript_43659:278-1306(+)
MQGSAKVWRWPIYQPILCMALDSVRNECAVGGADHGIKIFEVSTGKQQRELFTTKFGHHEWVTCITYLPDGRVVSGGMDSKLCLWESRGAKCIDLTGHQGSISGIKASANGKAMVSASYDTTLRVWETSHGKELLALRGHTGPILDFTWNGSLCASSSRDSTARLWDITTGQAIRVLKGHRGHVDCIDLVDDEAFSLVFTGAQDGSLRVWDLRVESCICTMILHEGAAINCVEASRPFSYGVVVCGADHSMHVCDPALGFRPRLRITDHKDFPYSLHVRSDLIFSGGGNGDLLVHDINSGVCLYGLGANRAAVRCIGTTSSHLVCAGDDGSAMIYSYPYPAH